MAECDVKVLGSWASPFVLRVRIALHIKSVNYEFIEENLSDSKSELLLKSNPVFKKVPVLIHGDKSICESLIIVQYIDKVWTSGPSILPSDAYERANSRFWVAYVDDKIKVIEKFSKIKLLTEAKTPCLLEWADSFSSHGAAKDVLPEADKLAEFGVKIKAKILKAMATPKLGRNQKYHKLRFKI
ncbi:hypothetical protein CRYUN_Cryun06bG0112700 [Craigia yunnanensis]